MVGRHVGDDVKRSLYGWSVTLLNITTVALILGVSVFVYRIDTLVTIDVAKSDARSHVDHAAAMLATELAGHETIATSLAAMVSLMPEDSEDAFTELASRMTEGREDILNLAYAPDLVVRLVYPYEANASVIGLDYRTSSEFTTGADKALETNAPVLIGPTNLLQGARGLILRVPFRQAWANGAEDQGLVSLVMNIDKLVEETAMLTMFEDYSIAAYSGDGEVSEKNVVFGSVSHCGPDALLSAAPIMDATWTFCIAPKAGWPVWGENSTVIISLAMLATLTTITVFVIVGALRARESKAKTQLWEAIEALNNGFVLYDKYDRLVLCNSKYRELYSASAPVIQQGAKFRDIIEYGAWNGEYAAAIGNEAEWIEERMAAHRDLEGEQEQQLVNGRWIKVAERKTSDGGTVGFRVDITDLKRAQHEAEAATWAITEFLTNINHEIRTPLSVIVGFVKFLARPEMLTSYKTMEKTLEEDNADPDRTRETVAAYSSDIKKYADRIEKSAAHLHSLVQDTLDMSKVAAGDFSLNPEPVNLGSLVTECAEQFADEAGKKGIDLQVDVPAFEIMADPVRLRQILFNLIGNAVKFTDSGHVNISLKPGEDDTVIRIADTGPGIAEEHRQRVFEKFWQIDGTVTRKHGGTGLGLAISDALVKLHGGEIWIESGEDDTGAIVFIRLPLLQPSRSAA